jgi:hypothetical protein
MWKELAAKVFPMNLKDAPYIGGIHGDGQFAVVMCTFQHPSGDGTKHDYYYGRVELCPTLEDAEIISREMHTKYPEYIPRGYCHGCTKLGSVVQHSIVDLGKARNIKGVPGYGRGWR